MIENIIPIYSIILSLLLINGFSNIGFQILKIKDYLNINNFVLSFAIYFFLIINSFALITFYISLYFGANELLISSLSIFIIFFGFYKPYYLIKLYQLITIKEIKTKIIYILLFLYFLLSTSPITDPDSLDYHITVPYYLLKFNNTFFSEYWLTSQLSGFGEAIFLYGLSIGAINFSQILQFFSLFLIVLLILNFDFKSIKIDKNKKKYVCLSILLIPVFLFLTTTSKPQLFPIAINFICLILSFFYISNKKNKKNFLILIIFFLFCTTQYKFSFFLSSGLIYIFVIYSVLNTKYFWITILNSFVLFVIIIFPRELYEYLNLNNNFFYNFFNPVTDNYSSVDFNSSLKHGTGNSRLLPLWMFIPYPTITQLTYSLGLTVMYFIFQFNLNKLIIKKSSIIILSYFVLGLIFAQPVGRFFLEPFLWLLFFSLFYSRKKKKLFQKIFEKLLILSAVIFICIIGFYSIKFLKGNFNEQYYKKVLKTNANGYELYEWANQVIPDNSVILSAHRSYAFYKYRVIPYSFRLYKTSRNEHGFKFYINKIIEQKPKYILYPSYELNNSNDILKECRGELFEFKKNVGRNVGRNPFKKAFVYDGYIFRVDQNKLENCKIK